jgi:hypothetical protein
MALLAIVSVLPYADTLVSDRRLFVRDLARYYDPAARVLRAVVRGGDFPHWNRAFAAGQPLAANPEFELFYPPRWLILLGDFDLGFRLHVLMHAPIAAVGMYLLLRSLALRIAAAVFGGLVFSLGGLFSSNLNLLPILFSLAWVPWVLLFARRAFRRGHARDLALASLFLGLQGLVGEPTTLFQTWLLVAGYGAYRSAVAADRARALARNAVRAAALVGAGLAVAAVQVVPAADLAADGARSRPFALEIVAQWSMPLARPLELLFPNVFGHLFGDDPVYWAAGLYPAAWSPYLFSIYLGLLPAVLAVAVVLAGTRRARLLASVGGASFLLALGGNTPVLAWLHGHGLPIHFRFPEKLAFVGLLALVILAAVGFDRFLRRDPIVRPAAVGFALGLTAVAAAAAVVSFTSAGRALHQALWVASDPSRLARAMQLAQHDWIVATLRGGLLVVLLLTGWRLRGRLWSAAALIFVFADVVPIGVAVAPRVPARYFTPPPAVAELRASPPFRIFPEVSWTEAGAEAAPWLGVVKDQPWILRNGSFP